MNFARNLQKARKKLGLTQAQIADKVGVRQNAISNYEQGVF
jgi:transcriptional regulator with XRE-family HTH domain